MAQIRQESNSNKEGYEVLNAFLYKDVGYYYLDNIIEQKIYEKSFLHSYKGYIRLFNTADSVCNFSEDPVKLKFFCPLADAFKIYSGLLTDDNFLYFENRYSKESSYDKHIINFSNLENPMVKPHSKDYYIRKEEKSKDLQEFPSMHVWGIYFTEDRKTALVAYTYKKQDTSDGSLTYHILKKRKGIWWKPMVAIGLFGGGL